MPLPDELRDFLRRPYIPGQPCEFRDRHIDDLPVFFFIPYKGDKRQQSTDPDWEKRTSTVVQWLAEHLHVSHVFREGSPDGQEWVSPFRTEEADEMLKAGKLKGEEHAATIRQDISVIGIDDMDQYWKSSEANEQIMSNNELIDNAIQNLSTILEQLASKTTPDTQELLKNRYAFAAWEIKLSDYFPRLVAEAESKGVPISSWNTICDFDRVLRMDKEIDFEKAEHERTHALESELKLRFDKRSLLGWPLQFLFPEGHFPDSSDLGSYAEMFAQRVRAIPCGLRALTESLPWRMAMYGAYKEGLKGLEDSGASSVDLLTAFVMGLVKGPQRIREFFQELVEDEHASSAELYDTSLNLALFLGVELSRIPNIVRYVRYGNLYRTIDGGKLFKQISELEDELLTRSLGGLTPTDGKGSVENTDREIVAVHRLFESLEKRVRLELFAEDASDFIAEDQREYCSQKLRSSPVLKVAMGHANEPLEILERFECLAKSFYEPSTGRGRDMAANLKGQIALHAIDRAIVVAGGFHDHSMLESLQAKEHPSIIVLLPMSTSAQASTDTSMFEMGTSLAGKDGWWTSVLHTSCSYPKGQCDNPFCRTVAPRYLEIIICLDAPGSLATFQCSCGRTLCGLEMKPINMTVNDFLDLPVSDLLKRLALKYDKWPFYLQCQHCGNLTGVRDQRIVWLGEEPLPY